MVKLEKDRKGRVYIAGPITDNPNYVEQFKAAEDVLTAQGLKVLSPASLGVVEDATWGDYMRACLKLIADCEAIYMLEGWHESRGAQVELRLAVELGIPVRDFNALKEALKGGQNWT